MSQRCYVFNKESFYFTGLAGLPFHPRQRAGWRARKFFKQLPCERPDVFEPVRSCAKQQNWNPKFRQVLLNRKVPVDGKECVEFFLSEREQIAVLDPTPAAFLNGRDFMADEIARIGDRRIRRAGPSLNRGRAHAFLWFFEKRNDLLARDAWKTLEKIFDGISAF